MSVSKAIVYVKAGCPWCIEALQLFAKEKLDVEVIDVLQDSTAYAEMQRLSGQDLTPTWVFEEEVIADFSVDEFQSALPENPKSQSLFIR